MIYIVYESAAAEYAHLLEACLVNRTEQVVSRVRGAFPMGDVIVRFFMHLESQCDIGFVVISESDTAIFWAATELAQQKSMGNCQRIYPAFLPGVTVPDWWRESGQRYLTIDEDVCSQVHSLLTIFLGNNENS
jgi:hypothetical protein